MQRLYTEVIISKCMEHQNLFSIEGVAPTLFKFCTVSGWMVNDCLLQYVTKNPEADRLVLVCPTGILG